jgi:iron complex outermembrane recepter protein
MGTTGSFEYYDTRPVAQQATVGNTGVSNSFGNPKLREEQADTFTLGMVMDFHDNFTLTVDWYEIEIEDMIALEGPDAIYQRCLSLEFNPSADPNTQPCALINRDPANGAPGNVDRTA